MKPQKLSTKSNPSGENMNLSEAFNQLKKQEHNASFDGLDKWLNQNTQKSKTMKTMYKIAASFLFATMILIACTVPVQQEEEIGYMIKGIVLEVDTNSKNKLNFRYMLEEAGIDPSQVSIHKLLHEEVEGKSEAMSEVIMVLPEANHSLAESKMYALSNVFDFTTVDIMPIEEKVERTLFESALHKLELKVDNELTDAKVAARINTFLHENSNAKGDAEVKVDIDGSRYVILEVGIDKNSGAATKHSIEKLVNDLTPGKQEVILEDFSQEEVLELKKKELQKLEEIREQNRNE